MNTNYYPFGLTMTGDWQKGSDYNYMYNGKELQRELDLGYYNYRARFYDPSIGRFISVDPFSNAFSYQSPYAYADNNPIKFIDFMGLGSSYNWESGRYEVTMCLGLKFRKSMALVRHLIKMVKIMVMVLE